ncbi:aminoacyl--tRNA ligase-related protein [Candidatus Omnitrophota bacterium]
MLFSKYFIPTLRKVSEESLSFRLSLKAGLISPLASGIYSYLPLGLRVLKKIENIIRKHMDNLGACEVLLPALQPLELWEKTGRDKLLAEVLIKFQDRRKRRLSLGPTHEEVVTDLVAKFLSSYKQLPLVLYQIQTKYRDELRPKSGLIRGCEFVMKDAYSFDADDAGLDKNYLNMYHAYSRIFTECGLKPIVLGADSGFIGGSVSEEFLAEASSGEDMVLLCNKCNSYFKEQDSCPQCKAADFAQRRALELGHIFKLGTDYARKLGAFFLDEKGKRLPVVMGCYGIGVSRIISAVIEQNHDSEGIIWPQAVAPFEIEIVCLNPEDRDILSFSFKLYEELKEKGFEVLFDERPETPGVKFNDTYLIGMPYVVVVGKRKFAEDKVEVVTRKNKKTVLVHKSDVIETVCAALAVGTNEP